MLIRISHGYRHINIIGALAATEIRFWHSVMTLISCHVAHSSKPSLKGMTLCSPRLCALVMACSMASWFFSSLPPGQALRCVCSGVFVCPSSPISGLIKAKSMGGKPQQGSALLTAAQMKHTPHMASTAVTILLVQTANAVCCFIVWHCCEVICKHPAVLTVCLSYC